MHRAALVLVVALAALPGVGRSEPLSRLRVGYGEADGTWRVGAGSGQYTAKDPNLAHLVTGGEVDPYNHSWTQRHSYGVQSRLSYRAIVVEGASGRRLAFVKADHYLASDALARRAAQILASDGSRVGYRDMLFMATHNHSSPFYYSPSWGVWLFQDVFDLRAFEEAARRIALAVERAEAALRPARMGATVVQHRIYKGNVAGPDLGDDGSPAGYPDSHADFGLTVVRFDEVPSGRPIAVLANFGQHPESLDGYDLITADYLAPLQRMVERETGAPLVWTQGDVGSAEGPYMSEEPERLPDGVLRVWAHVGHAQTERGARYLADDIVRAWRAIGEGQAIVPFTTDVPVAAAEAWVPAPLSHPYASVSNCRTETTVEGNPGLPVLGLPDCARLGETNRDAQTWEMLKATGLPLLEHYDAPSWGAVQENQRIRLQAFRLGEVLFASCSCEAQMDLILNFESRANDVTGDIFDGYEWPCARNADGTWTCAFGRRLEQTLVVSDAAHARMVAEVHNDARGWDAPGSALGSMTEPADPARIRGNFTKEELPPRLGYRLPIGVGHAAEYQGYVVSYREYMIRDHYRKALTAYGPHTADYMVTRMVRLAGSLKGGPPLEPEPLGPQALVDEQRERALVLALGRASQAAYDAWRRALPDDVGPARALVQPRDITRFQAATFTWRGGSNAVDNPVARVERLVDGRWTPFADASGEVQTMVDLPEGLAGALDAYTGRREWRWTASFEAFDAFPRSVIPGGQTPEGTYRFVVEGVLRSGGVDRPYRIASRPFSVSRFEGLVPLDPRREPDGSISFAGVRYPRTYRSPFRYIRDDGDPVLCRTCSFRPWAQVGEIASLVVHVVRAGGGTADVPAVRTGDRWVAATALGPSDAATIEPGALLDTFGEINGARIAL
jgi:hypothetical protein